MNFPSTNVTKHVALPVSIGCALLLRGATDGDDRLPVDEHIAAIDRLHSKIIHHRSYRSLQGLDTGR